MLVGLVGLTAGCSNDSSETAGPGPGSDATRASASPNPSRTATPPAPLPVGAPPPAIPLPEGVSTLAPPSPPTKGKGKKGRPAPGKTAPPAATEDVLALPAPGTYAYALIGTTSLGRPPADLDLTVAAAAGAGPGAQVWTFDGRRDDGSGLLEELTLGRQADGIYLSGYRLEASSGIAGVTLAFTPPKPVLLEPDRAKPGQTWSYDLESTDGCQAAHVDAVLVSDAKVASAGSRHVRLTTTVRTVGPPTCPSISAKRVQDNYHPAAALLPSRMDSDLQGSLAGIPVRADTEATLMPPEPQGTLRRQF